MKRILYFLILGLAFNAGSAQAQTKVNDQQAKAMLKEFYVAYNKAWGTRASKKKVTVLVYAVRDKYLTTKYNAELKKHDLLDDPLIGDNPADATEVKNLTVTTDTKRANTYYVNYFLPARTIDGSVIQVKVDRHILLANEKGKVKIAEVLYGK